MQTLKLFFLTFVSIFVCTVINAQDLDKENELAISVRDKSGGIVIGADVEIVDKDSKTALKNLLLKTQSRVLVVPLRAGIYEVIVSAKGFESQRKTIELKNQNESVTFVLEIELIIENVEIEQDPKSKALDSAMTLVLTEGEIQSLPESGEEIKAELKRRFGEDVRFRIDGSFDSKNFPSKEEISSIKVIKNVYDAEFHEIGFVIIDIRTKHIAKTFHGSFSFSFDNYRLDARNAFDRVKTPKNNARFSTSFSGPIIKNRTSFYVSAFAVPSYRTQHFIGALEEQENEQKISNDFTFVFANLKQKLTKNHDADIRFSHLRIGSDFLTAFDLPERRSSNKNATNSLSISIFGPLFGNHLNEFRAEYRNSLSRLQSESEARSIVILNYANFGGSGRNSSTKDNYLAITDILNLSLQKHALKIGGEATYESSNSIDDSNLNGTYLFSSIEQYQLAQPTRYSQTLFSTDVSYSDTRFALFAQDYFQLSKSVSASLGIRYEYQKLVRYPFGFSPRIGIAWALGSGGKFVFRGGAGIFYDWLSKDAQSMVLRSQVSNGNEIIILNPNYPDPFSGFVSELERNRSIAQFADKLTLPRIYSAQGSFAFKPSHKTSIETKYTFERGNHHFRIRDINAPLDGIRPDEEFGIIRQIESSGSSMRQQFELKVNQQFLSTYFNGAYYYTQAKSDSEGFYELPMDSRNLRLDWGNTGMVPTHRIQISTRIQPMKRLTITPSYSIDSGERYTVTTGFDDNQNSVLNDRPDGFIRGGETGEWRYIANLNVRWRIPFEELWNLDSKRIRASATATINNLFNTTNFTSYSGVQSSIYFRMPVAARDARSLELGISFSF